MENEGLNYIITYTGSKDDFLKEYKDTLKQYQCNITDYVQADDQTIVFMNYPGIKPGELEEKLSELNKGNLYIERDSKKNMIPEENNVKIQKDYKG